MRTSVRHHVEIRLKAYHGQTCGLAELIILRQKLDETFTADQKADFIALKIKVLWEMLSKRMKREKSRLKGIILNDAKLENTGIINSDLKNVMLMNADLMDISITKSILTPAKFNKATLKNVAFTDTTLNKTQLSQAKFCTVIIDGIQTSLADLTRSHHTN